MRIELQIGEIRLVDNFKLLIVAKLVKVVYCIHFAYLKSQGFCDVFTKLFCSSIYVIYCAIFTDQELNDIRAQCCSTNSQVGFKRF
jgi:hypothetical protein